MHEHELNTPSPYLAECWLLQLALPVPEQWLKCLLHCCKHWWHHLGQQFRCLWWQAAIRITLNEASTELRRGQGNNRLTAVRALTTLWRHTSGYCKHKEAANYLGSQAYVVWVIITQTRAMVAVATSLSDPLLRISMVQSLIICYCENQWSGSCAGQLTHRHRNVEESAGRIWVQ